MKITIELSILKLVYFPNFSFKKQLSFFEKDFSKKENFHSKTERINSSH